MLSNNIVERLFSGGKQQWEETFSQIELLLFKY